jgi:flagellar export protein FliJ
MARFQFSLEKVLRWRALELATEEANLERLVREQLRLQALRAQLGSEKSKLLSSLSTLPDLCGQDLRAATAFCIRLKRQGEQLTQVQTHCEQQLSEQRKKYREAKQRFRLLEELKERKLAVWKSEQKTELESLASESYLANWNRDRAENEKRSST